MKYLQCIGDRWIMQNGISKNSWRLRIIVSEMLWLRCLSTKKCNPQKKSSFLVLKACLMSKKWAITNNPDWIAVYLSSYFPMAIPQSPDSQYSHYVEISCLERPPFDVRLKDDFKTKSKCKYCGKYISWWITKNLKNIPISLIIVHGEIYKKKF